jgi:hypothetical protein
MLWAMLFYYLSTGSSGLVFDISEPVKQHVRNETTIKQIIAINEEMLKAEASLQNDTVKAKKQIAKINLNRHASEKEFAEAFAALDEKRARAREKILDGRFKMRELMTAEEWGSVYAETVQQDRSRVDRAGAIRSDAMGACAGRRYFPSNADIGRPNVPVVNQGDALMHIAQVKKFDTAAKRMEKIHEEARSAPLFDEDEVI